MSAIEDKQSLLNSEPDVYTTDAVEHDEHQSEGFSLLPHGSMAASAFNLASATLGAGTLALPQAMQQTGSVVGVVALLLSCAATVYSIRLLMIVLERTGYTTYEEIAKNLVGPRFEKLVAGLIIMFCWGITLVYVKGMGNILSSFNPVDGYPAIFKGEWGQRFITTIFWALFMLPLSLVREINTLRYASLVGMASTAILVAAIVVHAVQDDVGTKHLKPVQLTVSMIEALPIFSFSYCCQTNSFEIYAELKNRSVRKMTMTAAASMTACTCIYIIAGIAGFADFGSNTDGDILNNYGVPTKHVYVAVAVVAISFTLTMAFPICIFPTRDAVVQLLGYRDTYHTPAKVRVAICVALSTASIVVGLFVPHINLLFGLLGGIFGSSLGYILPAYFAWKSGPWTVETVGRADVIATWALFIGGVICGVGGTISNVYSNFAPSSSSSPPAATPNATNTTHNATELAASLLASSLLGW